MENILNVNFAAMEDNTTIFGIRTVIEAIQSEKNIDKIYIQKGLSNPLFQELLTLLNKKGYNISYVPVEKLQKLTQGNHQGVVAKISPIEFPEMEEVVEKILEEPNTTPLFLLLDQITDARNFGAIIRTAECCGVHAIIVQNKGGAPVNADTVKTSAGAVFNIPICKVNHIKDAIYYLQGSGVNVVAATEKSDTSLYETNLNQPTALVMGSEGRGINPSVLKIVNDKAKLPMFGTIGSLNVSVACGAFLYEIVRQRQ
jgi:23S rRNA (guanosine2251-2'-O)-methyltransferase